MGCHRYHNPRPILTLLPVCVCLPPKAFMRTSANHNTAVLPLVDAVVLARTRIAVLAGRQEGLRQVMPPPPTQERHPSSTTVDTPRAKLHLQSTLLRLVRPTTVTPTATATPPRGILGASKTHTSYNNQQAHTSRREEATQPIVHLLVRHQEKREQME